LCDALNSTIASLYTNVFSDVNATIYIQFGSTDLGQSEFWVDAYSYDDYRNALQADQSSAVDILSFSSNVPPVNPLGVNASVNLTNANARALGFSPTTGLMADAVTACTLGADGCYDGVITVSASLQSAGGFFFRSGPITPSQYDFFSIVEHETDEILGTPSCAFGCPNNGIFPSDLNRFQSNGARSFASGNNNSCFTRTAGNACLSYNGGASFNGQYYNINDGHDAGDWVPDCTAYYVQAATGCPGISGTDIDPVEIQVLDVVGYTLAVVVTDQRTSPTTGIVNGTCVITQADTSFMATDPEVWMNVGFINAKAGDSGTIVFSRPDGTTQTTVSVSPTLQGSNGAGCVSAMMAINGTSAESYWGEWTASLYWNQSATPVATLSFQIYEECYVSMSADGSLGAYGQSFSAAGGAGTISVMAPPVCEWSVTNFFNFVSLLGSTSGIGNGSITFQVPPNTSGGYLSGVLLFGNGGATYGEFTIEQSPISFPGMAAVGSLAHFASEGTWNYTLTAANLGKLGSPWATVRFNFWNDLGFAQVLPIIAPHSEPLLASTLDNTIASSSQVVLDTTGPAAIAALTGSVQVLASGNVGVFGIFSNPTYGWNAAVPLETRNAAKYVLAFDNTTAGGTTLATGVAVANVATAAANIPVIIRDDTGEQIGTASISLAAQGHTSFMLNQQYAVTSNRRGTIEFDTPGFGTQSAGQISVLGVRANGPALTTLPVVASSDTPGGTIAHVTYNGGFSSTFHLVNTGIVAASFSLSFFDANGNALPIPLSLPQSSATMTTSALTRTLAAGAMLVIETQANDGLPNISGSAQLTTTGSISGFEIFDWTTFGQEASVPLETRRPGSFLLIYDDTGGFTTGVALSNVAAAANIMVNIYDDVGTLLQTTNLSLPAKGHTSFMLPDQYSQTANIRGMVEFVVPQGGGISAIGVRATPSGTLTTIPMLTR
jgi:hypothetical protein